MSDKKPDLVCVVVIVHQRLKLSLGVSETGDPQKQEFLPRAKIVGEEVIQTHAYGEESSITIPYWLAEEKGLLPEERDPDTVDMFGGEG